MGKGYLKSKNKERNTYKEDEETDETYRTRQGLKLALPIYYRNYIYNEEEREKLWIEKKMQKDLRNTKQWSCLLYTSPSPRDRTRSRMPSSA